MLVADAFANDNARSGLVSVADLFAKNVKDDEGHEHGADGKFVSTGGSSGSAKEKPQAQAAMAMPRVQAKWGRTHDGIQRGEFTAKVKGSLSSPTALHRVSVKFDGHRAFLAYNCTSFGEVGGDYHNAVIKHVLAKAMTGVLENKPEITEFVNQNLMSSVEFAELTTPVDGKPNVGKPNAQFGKGTIASKIKSTDIAKKQIFKSLPKDIVEPAITAVTRELGSCSCMPKQLGILTDSPVPGVAAQSQAGALAWAMPSADGHVVRLMSNKDKWKTLMRAPLQNDNEAQMVALRVAPDKRADVVVTHEMGHVLEHAIDKATSIVRLNRATGIDVPDDTEEAKIATAYKAMMDERAAYADRKPGAEDPHNYVGYLHLLHGKRGPSRYARTKPSEYFAECYAAYRHGVKDAMPPKARELFDLLGSKEIEKALKGLWEVFGEPDGTSYDCHVLDAGTHQPKSLRETAHAFASLRLKKSTGDWSEEEHPRDEYGKFTEGFASGDNADLGDPGDTSTPEVGSPFAPGGTYGTYGPGSFSTGTAQPKPEAPIGGDEATVAAWNTLSTDEKNDAVHTAMHAVRALTDEDAKNYLAADPNAKKVLDVWAGDPSDSLHEKAKHLLSLIGNDEPSLSLIPPDFKPVKGWKQIGEQAGSNPGGVYRDADGNKHYVKFYANEDQAKNEALANSVYNVLGIPAPKSNLVDIDGKKAIANTMVDGLMEPDLDTIKANVNGKKGFVADAFLANHDVVGLTADNMLYDENGVVHRIDNGGALKFRAMGGPKSNLKTDEVPELNSMRNPQYMAGKVFGGLTADDMKPQAEHLVSTLTDPVIDKLIEKSGFDGEEALSYRELLRGRRDAIAKTFDIAEPGVQLDAPGANASEAEPADAVPVAPKAHLTLDDMADAKAYPPTHTAWMAAKAKFEEDGSVPSNWVKNKHLVKYMVNHKWKHEDQAKLAAAVASEALGHEVEPKLGETGKFYHLHIGDALASAEPDSLEPDAFDELMGNGKKPEVAAQSDAGMSKHEQDMKNIMSITGPTAQAVTLLGKYPKILAEFKAQADAGDAKAKALVDAHALANGMPEEFLSDAALPELTQGQKDHLKNILAPGDAGMKYVQELHDKANGDPAVQNYYGDILAHAKAKFAKPAVPVPVLKPHEKSIKNLVLAYPGNEVAQSYLDKYPDVLASFKADAHHLGDNKAKMIVDAYEKQKGASIAEPVKEQSVYHSQGVAAGIADALKSGAISLKDIQANAKNGDHTAKDMLDGLMHNGFITQEEANPDGMPDPKDAAAQAKSVKAALYLPHGWENMSTASKMAELKQHNDKEPLWVSMNESSYAIAQHKQKTKYMMEAIESAIPASVPLGNGPATYSIDTNTKPLQTKTLQTWINDGKQSEIDAYLSPDGKYGALSQKASVAAGVMKSDIPTIGDARYYADSIAEATMKPVQVTVKPNGTFGLKFKGVPDSVLPTPNSAAMTHPDDLLGSRTAPALSEVATSGPREDEGAKTFAPEYKEPKLALDPNVIPKKPEPVAEKKPKGKAEIKPASPHTLDDIKAIGASPHSLPGEIKAVLDPLRVARRKKWYGTVPSAEEIAQAKQSLFSNPEALSSMYAQVKHAYYIKPTTKKAYAKVLSEAFGQPMVLASQYGGSYGSTVMPKAQAEAEGKTILWQPSGKAGAKSGAAGTNAVGAPEADGWKATESPFDVPSPLQGATWSYARAVAAKASLPHDIARWAPFVTNEGEQAHVVAQLRAKGYTDAADHLADHYAAANKNPEMDSEAGMGDVIYPGAAKKWGNPALAPARLLHNAFLGEQKLPDRVSPKHLYAEKPEEREAAHNEAGGKYGTAGGWLASFYHHRDLAAKAGQVEAWKHPQWESKFAEGGANPEDYSFMGQAPSNMGGGLIESGDFDKAPDYMGSPIAPVDSIETPHGTFEGTHLREQTTGGTMASKDLGAKSALRVSQVLPTLIEQHKAKGGPRVDPFRALKPGQKPAPESAHAYALTQHYFEPLLQAARASLPPARVMQKLAAGDSAAGGRVAQDVARQMYAAMGVSELALNRLHNNISSWLGSGQSTGAYYLRTAANMLSGLHPAANTLLDKDSNTKHEEIKNLATSMTPGFLRAMLVHKAVTQAMAERFTNNEGTMPMMRGVDTAPASAVKAHATKDKNGQTIARLREQSISGYTTRPGAENPFADGARIFRHVAPHEIWHGYRFSPSHGHHESEQEHYVQHTDGGGYVPILSAADSGKAADVKGNALLPGKHGQTPHSAYKAMNDHWGANAY